MRLRLAATLIALTALTGHIGASELETRGFIRHMLDVVQATEVECSPEVLLMTQERGMRAVCARFDGTFELFRLRWTRGLGASTLDGDEGDAPTIPHAATLADWTRQAGTYEAVYSVGSSAVGVRFSLGQVLVVYQ